MSDAIKRTQNNDPQYWKPEPRRYNFAWWALLLPAIIYSAGVIVYAHNAFVPGLAQVNGHAMGSLLMVFGGEAGTLAAAAEVFRKKAAGEDTKLDWGGLAVSLVATLGKLFVVYVSLAPEFVAPWVLWVRVNGPLVLLLCSGVDFYAGLMEFGFLNASFDARWEKWNTDGHVWVEREIKRRQAAQGVTFTETETQQKDQPETEAQVSPKPKTKVKLSDRQNAIIEMLREDPNANKTQIGKALGVSRTTIANDMKVIKQAGI
jgi:hypothetical protein